jgi:hypothetical protein
MRSSSRKPAAILGLLCFLAIPAGAWLVFGAHETDGSRRQDASAGPKPIPAFWSKDKETSDTPGMMTTHGGWFCANPECRFLKMSGGQPFRSAKSQACSLCRQPLVPERPVAAAPNPAIPVTEPEGG